MRPPHLVLALVTASALGTAVAQTHEDTRYGFKFKPPKDFASVALQPGETRVVAHYQSEQPDYGGEQGYNAVYRDFRIFFWANSRFDDDVDPVEATWDFLDGILGYCDVESDKSTKVDREKGRERVLDPPDKLEKYFCTVVPFDDGVFAFLGSAEKDRFDKAERDFDRAVGSFKRIEKESREDREAEYAQLDPQERFLQQQIDKLPPGWEHLRTDRYLFLFNAEKSFVKEMAEQIEAMRDVYEEIWVPDEPVEDVSIVRVFANQSEFMGYSGTGASTGGYWNAGQKELVFYDKAPRSETLCVARHEAFHQYIYYFYGELAPHSWYNEGFGDYFSGARLTRSNRVSSFGAAPGGYDRRQSIKDAARLTEQGKSVSEGASPSLEEVLAFSQAEYYERGPNRRVAYYPWGWAFVHMLMEGRGLEDEWEEILPTYLDNLLEARHEVAVATMERAHRDAEKKKEGSSADLPQEPEAYYGAVDRGKVQDLAYEKTFEDWTDDDWAELDEFFLEYVQKL